MADRDFAHKAAAGFGPQGRPRQRAYNDALRDLVTPLMGHPPVMRVAVPDRDGAAAYGAGSGPAEGGRQMIQHERHCLASNRETCTSLVPRLFPKRKEAPTRASDLHESGGRYWV